MVMPTLSASMSVVGLESLSHRSSVNVANVRNNCNEGRVSSDDKVEVTIVVDTQDMPTQRDCEPERQSERDTRYFYPNASLKLAGRENAPSHEDGELGRHELPHLIGDLNSQAGEVVLEGKTTRKVGGSCTSARSCRNDDVNRVRAVNDSLLNANSLTTIPIHEGITPKNMPATT